MAPNKDTGVKQQAQAHSQAIAEHDKSRKELDRATAGMRLAKEKLVKAERTVEEAAMRAVEAEMEMDSYKGLLAEPAETQPSNDAILLPTLDLPDLNSCSETVKPQVEALATKLKENYERISGDLKHLQAAMEEIRGLASQKGTKNPAGTESDLPEPKRSKQEANGLGSQSSQQDARMDSQEAQDQRTKLDAPSWTHQAGAAKGGAP